MIAATPARLYADVGGLIEGPAGAAAPPRGGGAAPSFAATLARVAGDAARTVAEGEGAAMAGLAGTMDTHRVVAAITKAELTVQAAVGIRDKMVQAYQEIMRMPI